MKDDSIFLVIFFLTALVSILFSEGTPVATAVATEETAARCHNPILASEAQALLDASPVDPLALKALALRAGLCQLVEQGDISPQQASAIWKETPEFRIYPAGIHPGDT